MAASESAEAPNAISGYKMAGDAPQNLPVLVNIAIPLRNTGLLSSMVQAASDPSSSLFRHFLTPVQLQELFEPAAAFASMMQYLSTSGLKVDQTELDSVIIAQGTAGQVRQAFGSNVVLYTNGTSSYYMMGGGSSFQGASIYVSNVTGLIARPMIAAGGSQAPATTTFTEGSFSARVLQTVYNATALYKEGFNGTGQTIGILDFFGSPTIASDLAAYNQKFGFPTSPFEITSIGPYDPNLGVYEGWNTEISLDVELSHSMAPGATVDLYAANGALTLASAIAAVVQDDKVTALSQSFGIPEWEYSLLGPTFMVPNGIGADQFYEMGALEGITFSASTGDEGGSGFSSGPLGALEYPSSSPYVTALGGTQTYAYNQSGSTVFAQTGWSNFGFVPNLINEGGGTGGVSLLEPRPWYQTSQSVPSSYPNGRLNPDISLQAGGDPATYIVNAGSVTGEGGTSESTQLFGGLIALVASAEGGRLGLVNPFIYQLGNNPATNAKVFDSVTFGYIIPWKPSSGYNLATGWGALNAGEFASLWKSQHPGSTLEVGVNLTGAVDTSGLEYTPGTVMKIHASINDSSTPVTSGTFTATLVTLGSKSAATTSLSYDATSRLWVGNITMGDESGIAYLNVAGSSGAKSGQGFAELFAGYLGEDGLFPIEPYTTAPRGLLMPYVSTDLDGKPAPDATVSMAIDHYSILTNQYITVGTVTLNKTAPGSYSTNLTAAYPSGPTDIVTTGDTYGYLPMVMGIYLQNSYIYPEVVAEPGSIAAGQSLTVVTNPVAPINVADLVSQETGNLFYYDVMTGSNVTATLVNQEGQAVSNASLVYQPCNASVRVCQGTSSINGLLQVPAGSPSGLYTILLTANESSYTLGHTLNGSFYGQVWVSGAVLTPTISLSQTTVYQGQTVQVSADISYPSGQAVKLGEFTAFVFPQSLQSDFSDYMHTVYAADDLTPLKYDSASSSWVGTITLPSASNAGVLSEINNNAFSYSGPYSVMVTGLSYNGYPTSSSVSAAQPFFVQPYTLVENQTLSSLMQTSGLALSGDTVSTSTTLSNDLFLSSNTIQGGTVIITGSTIQGTLNVENAKLSLVGVSGGTITASNSQISLADSSVGSLSLTNSTVSLASSSYQSVTPSVPAIQISQPTGTTAYTGMLNITAAVSGQQISSVSFSVDGSVIQTFSPGNSSYTYTLDTTTISDGVHSLVVTATQQDGLSSSVATTFATDNQLASAQKTIGNLGSQLSSQNATITSLSGNLNSVSSNLNSANAKISSQANTLSSLTDGLYALGIIAIIALGVAIVAARRKEGPEATTPAASPPEATTPAASPP